MPRHRAEELEEIEDTAEVVDEQAEDLARAAALLGKAASDRKHRKEILKEAEDALSNLKLVDFPDLAESPVVQAFLKTMGTGDLQPGEVRNKGTLAEREHEWSLTDINRMVKAGTMPLKKFIPDESIPLTFNGVQIRIVAGEETEVPECFYNIWREHREALKQARVNERYMLGISDQMPHPNWQTPEGATVRAWSTQGEGRYKNYGTLNTGRITDDAGDGAKGD